MWFLWSWGVIPGNTGGRQGAKEEFTAPVSCCVHCAQAHGAALGCGLLPLRSEAIGIFVLMKPMHGLLRVSSGVINVLELVVIAV